jgi:hypothetical protein
MTKTVLWGIPSTASTLGYKIYLKEKQLSRACPMVVQMSLPCCPKSIFLYTHFYIISLPAELQISIYLLFPFLKIIFGI